MAKTIVTSALVLSLFVVSATPTKLSEGYHEDLAIRPLTDGKVITAFTFTTLLGGASPRDPRDSETSAQHYTFFPLTLGQILREYAVTELHLSLNAGKWNYDGWGYPDHPSVGTGAELWAWMADGGPLSVDERWIGLRNALAGLFCASIGSLDDRRTSSPASAFPLSSIPVHHDSIPYALRYATLPSEHVCTENLTPFLKLLPCKSRAGLARLLDPQHVFDADWHGLGVHVRSTEPGVELRLTVQAVLDPVRRSGGRRRDWSFLSLFNRRIDVPCPVANSSTVHLVVPAVRGYALSPEPVSSNDTVSVYSPTSHVPLDVAMSWPEEFTFNYPLPPPAPQTPLSIKRTLYGSSQTRGVLSVSLSNNGHVPITVGYLETLPALVTLWMHTLKVVVEGTPRVDLMSDIIYHPPLLLANGHHGPSTLQATLTIPPKRTLGLTLDLGKTFLRYTEHPPDAMRGWDLPPAVLFPVPVPIRSQGGRSIPERMYTPTLLLDLPTPDFSMPYNVIILSCTLITLIFGSIFNLLTRKWMVVKLED
ncbi:Gpi16 subunit, GPI transamidase component [Imleria badia]|nr:Gpi16 subunit, GPI transamidase component [Imleria badia]